jgi:hypothetical protein
MGSETKPVRLQRRRTKGFRLVSPNGLKIAYVTRPTIFGNPFKGPNAVDAYRRYLAGVTPIELGLEAGVTFAGRAPKWSHRRDVLDMLPKLRGANLACFCPLTRPCHADVLLELSNSDSVVLP